MPSQQRFEGPDLEGLLDEVRGRFGADVAIVEANKVRRGGVGGFFARELFEVVVEVDDPIGATPASSGAPASARPRTLLDLVDAVDDGPAPEVPTDDGIATLLARVAEARAAARPAPATASVSTEGHAFAAVLDRMVQATHEADASVGSEDDEPFRSFADVAAAPAPMVAAPVSAPHAPAARPLRRPATAPPGSQPDAVVLQQLGLPAPMLDDVPPGLDRLGGLLLLAERFPRAAPLPSTGDTVIALVGDRAGMERAVAWVLEHLRLPPERLVLASRSDSGVFPAARRIAGHEQAASRRRSWRRTTQPTVVVVDDPVGLRSGGWARHVLDALEPATVWAVVDAHRKPEDVGAWAARLGGVDAVALHGTAHTVSPAAVLATGVPVSLVDGHPATPARWAAVLDERLLAA